MRVLQVCHKPPFPEVDGGTIAEKQLTKGLIEIGHRVDIITLATEKHPFLEDQIPEWFKNQGTITAIKLNTYPTPKKALTNLFFSNKSFATSRFYSEELDRKLKHLKPVSYEVIIFDGLISALSLINNNSMPDISLLYRSHNIEYEVWKTMAASNTNPIKKWYFGFQAKRLQKEEEAIWKMVDSIGHISAERKDLKKISKFSKKEAFHLPFVFEGELQPIQKNRVSKSTFGFIGAMNWTPNAEAANFLFNQLRPLLVDTEVKIQIAGRFQPTNFLPLVAPNWKNQEDVDKKDEFFDSCTGFLLPLFSGSGVKVKAMEAIAKGIPLIATPKGVEGLNLLEGQMYLPASSPKEFFKQIIFLVEHPKEGQKIAKNAQDQLLKFFGKEVLHQQLKKGLNSII